MAKNPNKCQKPDKDGNIRISLAVKQNEYEALAAEAVASFRGVGAQARFIIASHLAAKEKPAA